MVVEGGCWRKVYCAHAAAPQPGCKISKGEVLSAEVWDCKINK